VGGLEKKAGLAYGEARIGKRPRGKHKKVSKLGCGGENQRGKQRKIKLPEGGLKGTACRKVGAADKG